MVKIVDKSPEEVEREQRTRRLSDIAHECLREAMPNIRLTRSPFGFSVAHQAGHSDCIYMDADKNAIKMNYLPGGYPNVFDAVVKLAERYEVEFGGEFTIKREYVVAEPVGKILPSKRD